MKYNVPGIFSSIDLGYNDAASNNFNSGMAVFVSLTVHQHPKLF